jgi:hypothetical protein
MDPLHDEETQLVTTLSSLEGSTSRHIAELFGSSLEDRAAFNARSNRIREDLAALRAATRDLAILAEEQDTCVLIDVAMLPTSSVRILDGAKRHRCLTVPHAGIVPPMHGVHAWKPSSPPAVCCREEACARLADMLKGHQAEYEKLQTAFKQANVQVQFCAASGRPSVK